MQNLTRICRANKEYGITIAQDGFNNMVESSFKESSVKIAS